MSDDEETWYDWLWGSEGDQRCGPLVCLSCAWMNYGAPTMEDVLKKDMQTLKSAQRVLVRKEMRVKQSIATELKNIKGYLKRDEMDYAKRAAKVVRTKRLECTALWAQQDTIGRCVAQVESQSTKAVVDKSLCSIVRIMAVRNGNVSPEAYKRMMALHMQAMEGQELRDEMFEEIVGQEESAESMSDNNNDDGGGPEDRAITDILLECSPNAPTKEPERADGFDNVDIGDAPVGVAIKDPKADDLTKRAKRPNDNE